MNKIYYYTFFVSLLLFIYTCRSNKEITSNDKNNIIYSENKTHIICFIFSQKIDSILYYNSPHKMIYKNTGVCTVAGRPFTLGSSGVTHWFSFVKSKDTMEIEFNSHFRINYCFNNIIFKKGKYKIEFNNKKMRNDEIYTKQGKEIFKNEETLLNTTVIYNPYGDFKGKTVKLKDLEFEYYDYKQKDFTLIKED